MLFVGKIWPIGFSIASPWFFGRSIMKHMLGR